MYILCSIENIINWCEERSEIDIWTNGQHFQ